jgi:phage baseplate assembly protein W
MSNKISNFTALVGNTLWELGGNFQYDFSAPPNSVEEVLQNVYEIWSCPLGSQPYLRSFGNDISWIDAPGSIGQMQMQVAFLVACARWEPRAKFTKIQMLLDPNSVPNGQYSLNVELEIDLTAQIQTTLVKGPSPALSWVVNNKMDGTTYPTVQDLSLTL